jgi:acetyl esterase/lipase
MNKREFLKAAATIAISTAAPRSFYAESQTAPKTYVYKTAGGCEIKADVYGSDVKLRKPVILWIHGGALIAGSRVAPPEWLDPEGRYVVVSIDYRLAPETKLPAIVEDLQDAYRWVREQGPGLFHTDSERLAVAGLSAGGYSTLMTGFSVSPRPRVLLSLSGYGDITSPWYSRPSPFYLKEPSISKEQAYRSVGTRCVTASKKGDDRWTFYLYCRQQGIWPKEVAGHNPDAEPNWFDRYCPVRNVSATYPPTLLIHGSADTDVPYEESVKMDEKLSQFKVHHEFLRVPGGSHCLGDDPPAVRTPVFRQAMEFVKAQMS